MDNVTTKLSVPEMMCSHCENNVKAKLSSLKFVEAVEVDLAAKTVTVTHSDSLSPNTLIDALDDAGYDASVI